MDFSRFSDTVNRQLDELPLIKYWWIVIGYIVVAALFIQFIILPFFLSDYHWGQGLLTERDAVTYHRISKVLSERIHADGISQWSIKPYIESDDLPAVKSGINGIVSLIYAYIAPEPWTVIPLNAIVHATSALLLVYVFLLLGVRKSWAILATLPFVFYPSSAQWWSQIGKDGVLILGVFMLVWSFLMGVHARYKRDYIYMIAGLLVGFYFIWMMRSYMLPIISVASLLMAIVFIAHSVLVRRNGKLYFAVFYMASMLSVIVFFDYTEYSSTSPSAVSSNEIVPKSVEKSPSIYLVDSLSNIDVRTISLVNKIRDGFDVVKANSSIDSDVRFSSIADIILYVPRAMQIGLFSPFPNQWLKSGSSEPNTMMKRVAMFEMGLFYLFFLFLLLNLKWVLRRPDVFYVLLVSVFIIVAYSFFVTNVGNLYRMRFSFLMIVYGISIISFLRLICSK